jgi:hypothetical protein
MKILEERPIQPTRGHGQEQDQLRGRAGHQGMEVKVPSTGLKFKNAMIISKLAKAPNLRAIAKQLTRSHTQSQLSRRLKLAHTASPNQNGKRD